MTADDVVHPGARPSEFEFPFEQARRLVAATDELVGELTSAIQRRERSIAAVVPRWFGASRERFEAEADAELARLRRLRAQLEGQLGELEEAIATATGRREESLEAIARWESRMADYRQGQRAD